MSLCKLLANFIAKPYGALDPNNLITTVQPILVLLNLDSGWGESILLLI